MIGVGVEVKEELYLFSVFTSMILSSLAHSILIFVRSSMVYGSVSAHTTASNEFYDYVLSLLIEYYLRMWCSNSDIEV